MKAIEQLRESYPHLRLNDIEVWCSHSRSQLYEWRREVTDRKQRDPKHLPEEVIENAAMVITELPHMGGKKGQAYMLYHEFGYIGMKAYDALKKQVKRILVQEAGNRKDIPEGESYEHIRANAVGEIWAEDFTEVCLCGVKFKVALLIDVYSQYLLGCSLSCCATESFVAGPVLQAIEANSGKGPELFMLQDNGKQYVSEKHGNLLSSLDIVQRCIPAGKPQYNGSVECGGKEFKNVFYNVWERREREGTDKEKSHLDRARMTMEETVWLINWEIPRPSHDGVTPGDVQYGRKAERIAVINQYKETELAKDDPPPHTRPHWDILKGGVKAGQMDTKELLTKMAFFFYRPLRRIAKLNLEVWGN